jgi:cation diffusion facilitator family transporter
MKSKAFIYIALGVDVLIAVTKFIAAGITHSSGMLSESIHSVIDALSQLLLIWGIVTSKRKANTSRPFGYGRELYFWSFIVSLIIFLVGGCISFYEGLLRFKKPMDGGDPSWSYIVITIAFVFTAVSARASFKAFKKRPFGTSFIQAIKKSKDPSTFIILLSDLGDLAGLIIAFAGVYFSHLFYTPLYDGLASLLIGLILIIISLVLVNESRSLLMGEPVSGKTIKIIVGLAETDPSILKVKRKLSTYLAPEEVVLQLTAVFKKDLTTEQITNSISTITKKIQTQFPLIKQIFIEPVEK